MLKSSLIWKEAPVISYEGLTLVVNKAMCIYNWPKCTFRFGYLASIASISCCVLSRRTFPTIEISKHSLNIAYSRDACTMRHYSVSKAVKAAWKKEQSSIKGNYLAVIAASLK